MSTPTWSYTTTSGPLQRVKEDMHKKEDAIIGGAIHASVELRRQFEAVRKAVEILAGQAGVGTVQAHPGKNVIVTASGAYNPLNTGGTAPDTITLTITRDP